MKAFTSLIFSLIVLYYLACKNSDNPQYSVDVTVLNQQGQNLLAPPLGYTRENIEIYYVVSGTAQLYSPNANKGFQLFKDLSNKEVIRIDLNHDRNEKYPLTLVKFGNSKIDTIKAKFTYSNQSSAIIQAVWLNGVQKDIKGFIIIK